MTNPVQLPDAAVQAAMDELRKGGGVEGMLAAALPYLPLGFEVKQLEWKPRANGGFTCIDDNKYCIDFWENEKLYVGSYTTMERSKNADDVKEALQKKFERRVRECLVGQLLGNPEQLKTVDVAAVRKAAELACMYLANDFIECDRCGHEVETKNTDAEYTLRKALSDEPAQGEQWRPIETAPKDMTEIIVLCGQKDIRLGWYFAPSSQTFGWFDQRQKKINPTHWMPLPAAPTQEVEA